MKKINLRDMYPKYTLDCYIDIPESDVAGFLANLTRDIADVYIAAKREEIAYKRRMYDNKAHYSLDFGDGIEADALHSVPSPEEIYEAKMEKQKLYAVLASLSDKQARRIYAHFFLDMSNTEIAQLENIHESSIRESISHGLQQMAEKIKKLSDTPPKTQ